MEKKFINLKIDPVKYQKLKIYAVINGKTITGLIDEIFEEYAERVGSTQLPVKIGRV